MTDPAKKEYSRETMLRILDWVYTPTVRGQWKAFWGMYRTLRAHEHWPNMELFDSVPTCLSRLCRVWFLAMRHIDNMSDDRYAIPIFMRLTQWKTMGYLMLGREGHRCRRKE